MKKRQTGFRFTEISLNWLKAQAEQRGISMNGVLQEMINKEMAQEQSKAA